MVQGKRRVSGHEDLIGRQTIGANLPPPPPPSVALKNLQSKKFQNSTIVDHRLAWSVHHRINKDCK